MVFRRYIRLDKPLKIRYNIARYEKAMTRKERIGQACISEPGAVRARRQEPKRSPLRSLRRRAGRMPALKAREGMPFGRINRSGTANRVCSSPGRQAFFYYLA